MTKEDKIQISLGLKFECTRCFEVVSNFNDEGSFHNDTRKLVKLCDDCFTDFIAYMAERYSRDEE